MLSDITAFGVRAAIREFDELGRERFSDKYGFGKSRQYFLLQDGRQYDSKAIAGAAHGFDFPEQGPLREADFSGDAATVQRTLEALGFDVTSGHTGSGWTEEERVLALDLYLREGDLRRTREPVIALSRELQERAFHPDAGSRDNFRSPSSVARKLANFAALDPNYENTGLERGSKGDEETWNEFASDRAALAKAIAAIRAGQDLPPPAVASYGPQRRPLERHLNDTFEIDQTPRETAEGRRRESELVQQFANWLEGAGHEVCAHHYPATSPPLRCDLFDETTNTLWEAKSEVGRFAIRLAIGQLLDYSRFEQGNVRLGILVPSAPCNDLLALIQSLEMSCAWPTGNETFAAVHSERHEIPSP